MATESRHAMGYCPYKRTAWHRGRRQAFMSKCAGQQRPRPGFQNNYVVRLCSRSWPKITVALSRCLFVSLCVLARFLDFLGHRALAVKRNRMALDGEELILLDRRVEVESLMSQDAVKPRGDSAREDVKAGHLDASFETQCGHRLQVSEGVQSELSLVSPGAEACEAVMRKRGREAASVAADSKQAGSKSQRRRLRKKTECSWKEYVGAGEKSKERKLSANIAVEHETLEKALYKSKHNESIRKNC